MKTLHFSIWIQAPRERVYHTMLNAESYQQWTSVFMEGSYYKGTWDEGQTIRFLAPNGCGMISQVAVNRPHEFVSLKHVGWIENGVEDTDSEQARSWLPAYENYTFTERDGGTELTIVQDTLESCEQEMSAMWLKGLDKLKSLCETSGT